jgi:hypothetical protein
LRTLSFGRAAVLFLIGVSAGWSAEALPGTFAISGPERPAWTRILRSMGLVPAPEPVARLFLDSTSADDTTAALARIDGGAVAILQGDSELARALGFVPTGKTVANRRVRDVHNLKMTITWREAGQVPLFRIPKEARVFAAGEHRAPLVAGIRRGRGAALWVAVEPGTEGYERFPYLPQALADLGVESPFVSRRLWAFFDPGVHGRIADPDALAAEWRRSGIAGVQIAVWDFYEGSPEQMAFLRRIIEACHRHLVLAYAWFELPHVSRPFWDDHPEWREKTALNKDAAVDWRRLMNLADPACEKEVRRGVRQMVMGLDWDGVNLAELYFDGVQGTANLHEFTPLNAYVRNEFQASHGFDPLTLFQHPALPERMRAFLEYRTELSARLEARWIDALEEMRVEKPGLDLVLTHVDDLFDTSMRDALGADATRAVKLLNRHQMTLLVEDPATLWSLGPRRYAEIARRYAAMPAPMDRVGVDINVVARDGGPFPTATQTGLELMQLIHTASESFSRVAYYCESTIEDVDLRFLPAAAAAVSTWGRGEGGVTIESRDGIGVKWDGPALVDGAPWPIQDGKIVWVPAGRHRLQNAPTLPPFTVEDFNGTLEGARVIPEGIEISYRSDAPVLATLSRKLEGWTIDGVAGEPEIRSGTGSSGVVSMPKGTHRMRLRFSPGPNIIKPR